MDRAELVKTLELVKPALAANNMVPIFQCFIFNGGSVSAYNDTVAIVGPCEIEETCGIHGVTLLGLLSNNKAEAFDLKLDQATITIKAGKTINQLPFQPEENFIFNAPADKWASKIPFTQSLFEAMELCLETVSKDETQGALLGVTIELDKMYSCNGDALTRVQLKHGRKGRVLLPTAFCDAVVKLWSALEMTKGALHFNDDWIFADFEEWSVYGRVLEISNPIDFEGLIKDNTKGNVPTYPLPEGFSEALSRARVLADPESQKTTATVSKGKLHLSTITHMGEVSDFLSIKGHSDVKAAVNASHLQSAAEGCDQIAILDSCVVVKNGDDVFKLVSNMR